MTKLKWKSIDKVGDINIPVYFVAGDADNFVPTWMTQLLYDRARAAPFRDIFLVPGGDHNDTFIKAGANYHIRMNNFFK